MSNHTLCFFHFRIFNKIFARVKSNAINLRACPSARTYFKQVSQRKSTHFEGWNFDGEGKNQASGCFEDLAPTSKAKTVKGDRKNTMKFNLDITDFHGAEVHCSVSSASARTHRA